MTTKDNMTYADAGVNIDAGNALVDKIKPLAAMTRRVGSMDGIGGFGGLFDLKACGYNDPLLVSATDGVGTKLKLAFATGRHETVGIDLVAMCVNDLLVQGAEPLFFLDYLACGALSVEQARDVIAGIAKGCELAGCQLIGGETAEMPGMYQEDEYDLAGFSVGAVERNNLLPDKDALKTGDVVLGLASSGLHSNGFSLVRRLLEEEGIKLSDPAQFASGKSVGGALLEPTRVYIRSCLPLVQSRTIKAMAHITGGGLLENIPRILPGHLACELDSNSWEWSPVFQWIRSTDRIAASEMLRTFNCGIGMVAIVEAGQAGAVQAALQEAGETVSIIGKVVERQDQAVIVTGDAQ